MHYVPLRKTLLSLGRNISAADKACLKNLATEPTIVINQADKGGDLLVWDRGDYVKEGEPQLSDNYASHG